jgi:hypothetical protein
LALLIEAIAASFGDSKPDLSLDKYLPYPLEDNSEVDTHGVSQLAVNTFWEMRTARQLPPLVEKAFLHNEELFKILESMKKNP